MKAKFLRHEGYLGAVGAFMKSLQTSPTLPNGDTSGGSSDATNTTPTATTRTTSKCWAESYATALISRSNKEMMAPTLSEFELEHLGEMSLEPFPLLLSSVDYAPDTWDLTQDSKARVYWLECFKVRELRLFHLG